MKYEHLELVLRFALIYIPPLDSRICGTSPPRYIIYTSIRTSSRSHQSYQLQQKNLSSLLGQKKITVSLSLSLRASHSYPSRARSPRLSPERGGAGGAGVSPLQAFITPHANTDKACIRNRFAPSFQSCSCAILDITLMICTSARSTPPAGAEERWTREAHKERRAGG